MLLCLLRTTGVIGASLLVLMIKLVALTVVAVSYLSAVMLLQHLKAVYLGNLCETVLLCVSSQACRRVLLVRLQHLENKTFHQYYHGRKPVPAVLFEGLSIVCDWWRYQSPDPIPPSAPVYLRLTCKALHQLEQLAATHLNLKAPLHPSGIQMALNRPASWIRVQSVLYLHHKPEQIHALTLFATAWPNLRQLRVTKPQYLQLQQHRDEHGGWVCQGGSSSHGVADHAASAVAGTPAALAAGAGAAAAGGGAIQPPGYSMDSATSSQHQTSSSSVSSSAYCPQALRTARASSSGAVLLLVAGLVSCAQYWPSLQCLSLSNLGLASDAAELLVQAAAHWPLLRCLDVTDNNLGSCDVLILLDAVMQYWQQLEVLDMRGNVTSSSSSRAAVAGSSSSTGAEICASVRLGEVSEQATQLFQCGWKTVVVHSQQRQQQQMIPAAVAGSGWMGACRSSCGSTWQQQQQCWTGSCPYIPTEGLIACQVHLLL